MTIRQYVCFWIVSDESKETLLIMITLFKRCNPNWESIKCIMADKDLKERDSISQAIPNTLILICLFHVLRNFQREITTEKYGITQDQRLQALEIIQKMAYARSESDNTSLNKGGKH
jgi:hypothetical protein